MKGFVWFLRNKEKGGKSHVLIIELFAIRNANRKKKFWDRNCSECMRSGNLDSGWLLRSWTGTSGSCKLENQRLLIPISPASSINEIRAGFILDDQAS